MTDRTLIEGCAIATVDARRQRARERPHRDRGRGDRRDRRGARARRRDRPQDRGRRAARDAGPRQLPPPPVPVGDTRARAGRGPVPLARSPCTRAGPIDDAVQSAAANAGLAALALSGCSTSDRPPLPLPARRRRPARRRGGRLARARRALPPVPRIDGPRPLQGGLPPDDVVEDRDAILEATSQAIDRYHDTSPGAMTRIAVAPCSPFSVTEALMTESAALARTRGVRLHTHLAETIDEEQFCQERFGCRPVEYLERLGWLGDDVWLAHCVHIDASRGRALRRDAHRRRALPELERAPRDGHRAGRRARCAPARTSASASTGRPRTRRASSAGELRQAMLFARLRDGAAALTAREALALGTIHGARCLGRGDEIGSLEVGKRADIALWRIDDIWHAGIDDPVAALVFGAAPRVHMLLVEGRVVVEGGELRTASEQAIAHDLRAQSTRLAERAARAGSLHEHARRTARDRAGRREPIDGGVGESVLRPDGTLKVQGQFAYSSDLQAERMLWGATVRSPHPHARIRSIEIAPGARDARRRRRADARGRARAQDLRARASRPARARVGRGALPGRGGRDRRGRPPRDRAPGRGRASRSSTRCCRSSTTPSWRCCPTRRSCTRAATCCATCRSATATPSCARPTWSCEGEYEVGMQDQAFLGPESGLAVPDGEGGVDLYIATQWLHVDRDQLAAEPRARPERRCAITLAGVGGAFGAREDLSMQIHACLLALHTDRPVKLVYGREESFFGHVHRHPARMHYDARRDPRRQARLRPRADRARRRRLRLELGRGRRERRLLRRRAVRLPERVDRQLRRLHRQPAVRRDARLRRGADLLRLRVADGQAGRRARARPGRAAAAQRDGRGLAPADRAGRRGPDARSPSCSSDCARCRCPDRTRRRRRPAAAARRRRQRDARRERAPRRRLRRRASRTSASPRASTTTRPRACASRSSAAEPQVEVHTAAAEVGPGPRDDRGADRAQRARRRARRRRARGHARRLGRLLLGLAPDLDDRRRGQVRVRRGARPRAAARDAEHLGDGELELAGGEVRRADGAARSGSPSCSATTSIEETCEHHHRPTSPLDAETGQGDAHVAFAFSAHRAVVDVDIELGLVRVVEIATAQDVGKALNPQAVEGQIEGGIAQGLGLALMEEIQVVGRASAQPVVHRLPDPDHPRHAAGAHAGARARRPARAVRARRASASRRRSRRRRRSSPRVRAATGARARARARPPRRHRRPHGRTGA